MTAALTPHRWEAPSLNLLRAAILCCAMGNHTRMNEHLEALPRDAIDDLCHQLPVMLAKVNALAGQTLPVPCPRCGHDEGGHDWGARFGEVGQLCIGCGGYCSPVVLVPANVDGWAIGGRG